jgi:hypothetical protein
MMFCHNLSGIAKILLQLSKKTATQKSFLPPLAKPETVSSQPYDPRAVLAFHFSQIYMAMMIVKKSKRY